MRTIRLVILSIGLLLAVSIPAFADCSLCVTTVYVNPDGPGQTTDAECQLSAGGTIPDCQVVYFGGIPNCVSGQKVAICGEYLSTCPPWECPPTLTAEAPKQRFVTRPAVRRIQG